MNIVVNVNAGDAVTFDADQITAQGGMLAFWRTSSLLAEIPMSDVMAIALEVDTFAEADGQATAPSYSVAAIRETYPNAYARWTAVEDARLLQSRARRVPIARIAASHGRQESAIRSRIRKLVPDASELDGGQSDAGSAPDESVHSGRTVRFSAQPTGLGHDTEVS
ncbi:hypothetical protein [Leifsonia sp. TF02-11]|uniref:hypothetical protein n=1 Tax=Leifsonia sp. TF02-11 TaxID=2815212 RepID=UPI001AA13C7A|nr:hypothetical protein [Leifsonia sp. TF02-11]MBO1739912.1 hypothetical protein [Leifsonia sp. TF02-11]